MKELIEKAQGGDWHALCDVVEKLKERIERMAEYYAAHCNEDSKDLTQEAWLGALEALKKVDINIGDPQQFLIKRAKWKMLDFTKWSKRRQHESLEEIDPSEHPTIQQQSLAPMILSQFSTKLSHKQQLLVHLLLAGNTWREAAEKLGCTSANVAYHIRQIQRLYAHWISR